jgi:hypothetical protein
MCPCTCEHNKVPTWADIRRSAIFTAVCVVWATDLIIWVAVATRMGWLSFN